MPSSKQFRADRKRSVKMPSHRFGVVNLLAASPDGRDLIEVPVSVARVIAKECGMAVGFDGPDGAYYARKRDLSYETRTKFSTQVF